MLIRFLCMSLACAFCFCFSCGESRADERNLIIATAATGGTYYPVGVAIGTLISTKLVGEQGLTATAINSTGSGENLRMLRTGKADMAIMQALYGQEAYNGEGAYQGQAFKDFRAVTMLWENVEHFALLARNVRTGTIADIEGLHGKFSIGKRGSGNEGSGRAILSALGIDPETQTTLEYLAYTPSVQAMIDNVVAGANIPAGPPVAAITTLFTQLGADKVRVLDFTDEQLAAVRRKYPIWNRYVIPAGTYPGQEQAINTIAQPNFLACRADLHEDVVYAITKTIYENLPFLNAIHKATMAMKLERATIGLPVPLHPGAERYFREAGVLP